MERNYNYNKTGSYLNRYAHKKPKTGRAVKKINKNFFEKMANQFIAASAIALIVIIISNIKIPFVEDVLDGVKWVAGTNYDFNTIVDSVLPGVNDSINEITGAVGNIFGDDKSVDTVSENTMSYAILPVEGEIISGFKSSEVPENSGEQHSGIDIKSEEGTPIKAALDGVVIKIEENETLGRTVMIKHENGLETLYAHCSEILVDENQNVKQGDYIAKVGKTGIADEPHLHFEVLKDGILIDPLSEIGSSLKAM